MPLFPFSQAVKFAQSHTFEVNEQKSRIPSVAPPSMLVNPSQEPADKMSSTLPQSMP